MTTLHGDALRQTLRQICMVPMPPPREEITMQRAEAARGDGARTNSANQKLNQSQAQQAMVAKRKANRPVGCVTLKEAIARSRYKAGYGFRAAMKRAGIVRESYDGCLAWYSEAKLKAAGIITGVMLALLPGVGGAQTEATVPGPMLCGQAAEIHKEAEAKFGETVNGIGATASGHLVELLFDQRDQSWTLIRVMPGGMACIIGTGEHWEHGPIGEPS